MIGVATVVSAAAVVLGLVAWRSADGSGSPSAAETTPAEQEAGDAAETQATAGALPGLQRDKAAWVAEQEQLPARLDAIRVPFSNMEGTAPHIHPGLSVSVNGELVTVPTDIGINAEQAMAALHTHDTVGTIHVESPVKLANGQQIVVAFGAPAQIRKAAS